jgi:hypothetical protein
MTVQWSMQGPGHNSATVVIICLIWPLIFAFFPCLKQQVNMADEEVYWSKESRTPMCVGLRKTETLMTSLVRGFMKIFLHWMKGSPLCPNIIGLFKSPTIYVSVHFWLFLGFTHMCFAGCSISKVPGVVSRFSMPYLSCLWTIQSPFS